MQTNGNRLFVYDTLRRGFKHPAYEYLSTHFVLLGDARVTGILYDLGLYPGAVPASKESFILGELYQLKSPGEFKWVIDQLDDYEGLNPQEGETALYKREITNVFYNDGIVDAWIYWYNQDVTGFPQIPSGDFFNKMTNNHNF